MSDVQFTEAETKFFATKGEAGLAPVEQPVSQTPEPTPEPVVEAEKPAEAKPEGETEEKREWPAERYKTEYLAIKPSLKEERKLRKEAERERERLIGRISELEKRAAPPPVETPKDPAMRDPLAELEELRQWKQSEEQTRHRNSQMGELTSIYRTHADEFAAKSPDFYEAQTHFNKTLVKELQKLGNDPKAAADRAVEIEAAAVLAALRDGENPARRIYELAQLRGYTTKKPEPAKEEVKAPDKIKALEQAQAASKSLGNASGVAKAAPTITALLEMDEDEQIALLTNPKEFRRLAGG